MSAGLRAGCVPSTCMEPPLAMRAAFGRTQYRRGAVVLTLKHTSWLYGFSSRMNCCACALSSTGRHRAPESAPRTAGRRRRQAGAMRCGGGLGVGEGIRARGLALPLRRTGERVRVAAMAIAPALAGGGGERSAPLAGPLVARGGGWASHV